MKPVTLQFVFTIVLVLFFSLSGNAQCSPEIAGYTNIGLYNDHGYYLSNSNARPTDAQAAAEALGGYLVVINDADENEFIENYVEELTYIGFNDATIEGTIEAVNGEPVTYTNIDPCSFCQSNDANNDFVVMEPWGNGGEWSFSNFWNARKYIVEIPCSTSNNSSECSFIEEVTAQSFPGGVASSSGRIIENNDDYEIRSEFVLFGPERRLVSWKFDKLGNEISVTDVSSSFPSGMDFGRISDLGEYFFMHEIIGLNPQLNKYDFLGNTIFSKNYTVNTTISNISYTASRDAWEDEDGILITGHSGDGPDGLRQPFLIKTDLDGNEQWQVLLPTENKFVSLNVQGRSNDGGYYLNLSIGSNLAEKIIKIDAVGNILWTYETLLNSSIVDRNHLGESPDGLSYYYVQNDAGSSSSIGYWGFRLDASTGAVIWEKEISELFSISPSIHEFGGNGAAISSDGGLFVDFSYFLNNTYVGDKYGRLNSNGDLVWGYDKPKHFRRTSSRLGTSDDGLLMYGVIGNDFSKRFVIKINGDGSYAPICEGGTSVGLQVNCDLNIDPAELTVVGTNDPAGNIVNWTPPIATTDCPGGVTITQISGSPSGSFLTAWFNHIVVYEVTDACGNSEICYNEVFIDGSYGGITCPDDITVSATSPDGAIVNYDVPVAIQGTCIIGTPELVNGPNTASGSLFPIGTTEVQYVAFAGGSNTFCQTNRLCTFNITVTDGNTGGGCPNDISGFTTLGEFGDSKYYISNSFSRPVDAQAVAESFGGYLVTINSQAENDFIQQYADGLTYIGLTDENTEGNLEWFNGDPFSYNNVDPCGFCNENSANQDYGVIQPWDGGWSFSNFWNSRKYIMEIPCSGGNDGCGFITSFEMPPANLYSLGSVDFEETNDNYLVNLKYNGNNGPNTLYETKLFSKEGVDDGSINAGTPPGYSASINGLTIDLSFMLNGTTQWTQNIPVTTNDPFFDAITSVRVVNDENGVWIVGGYHYGNAATWKTFAIRTDLNGNFISQSIHDTIADFPVFLTVETNRDGGVYFLLRTSSATGVLYRTDANGDVEWTKNIIGDLVSNRIFLIGETADASALYLGINQQFNTAKLRKYNTTNGELILDQGLAFGSGMTYTSGVVTSDDGVVTSVSYNDFGTSNRFNDIVRLDENGNEIWRHNLPFGLTTLGATSDGGFVFLSRVGNYGRLVKVNSEGLFESTCTNDEKPELQPSNIDLDDFQYEVGDMATFSVDVSNLSLTSVSGSYTVKASLRPYLMPGPSEIVLGEYTLDNTPFGIAMLSESFLIPNVAQGNYRFVIQVDIDNDVDELLETNNEILNGPIINIELNNSNLPDLTIPTINNLPSSGEIGDVVFFDIDLSNIGNVTATGNYNINFYISTNNSFSSDDVFAGEIPKGDTPVGTTLAVPSAIAVPNLPAGNYYLVGVADVGNNIVELIETNNVVSTLFAITSSGGGCSTGATSILPCDDGNPCTIDDYSIILDADGSICEPCTGILIDCSTGSTTVQSCDDGDPNTTNDMETISDCDGSICVPCQGTLISGCPTSLSGFTSLGEYNGSAYFLSNDVSRPTDAQNTASSNGGNLAVINSQGENDFIYNQINELVYIGINDATIEGTLEWVDGSGVGYTNFDICSFCNENESNYDYVVMHGWNGGWSWSSVWNQRKYIVEIPCMVPLQSPNVNNTLIAFPTIDRESVTFDKLIPNPANEYIFASIFSPSEKEVEIQIMDARGVLVKSKVVGVHKGSNTIEMNIAELPSGFYMMYVLNASTKKSMLRFVKVRD